MGRYTAWDDPRVDDFIEATLGNVVTSVAAKCNPVSVILMGSFARGEGTVLLTSDGPRMVSDIEVAVVTNRLTHLWTLGRLSDQLAKQLGLELTLNRFTTARLRYSLPSNYSLRKAPPTIEMYEVQSASRLLYGLDLVAKMTPCDAQRIPLWEGIRLVLNRMAGVLGLLAMPAPVAAQPNDHIRLPYALGKLVLACADSILLSAGEYHYSYRERDRRFQQYYPRFCRERPEFPDHLASLVADATSAKLWPKEPAADPEQISHTLQQVIRFCDATFRYLLRREMALEFDSYGDFPILYLSRARSNGSYQTGLTPAWWYQDIVTLKRLSRFPRLCWLLCTRKLGLPWVHFVYSLVPALFFAIDPTAKQNEYALTSARDQLSPLLRTPARSLNGAELWRQLASLTHRLWRALCT